MFRRDCSSLTWFLWASGLVSDGLANNNSSATVPPGSVLSSYADLRTAAASHPCRCSGSNTGIDTSVYGPDYGKQCKAYEDGATYPANSQACGRTSGASVGRWCCRAWCYVDPATCNGLATPYSSSFVTSQATLFYSYAACEPGWLGAVADVTNTAATVPEKTYDPYENCPFSGPYDFQPGSVRLWVTVRDVDEGAHSHFGCDRCVTPQNAIGSNRGMVEDTLNSDGKPDLRPTFPNQHINDFRQWYSSSANTHQGAESDFRCASVVPIDFQYDQALGLHVYDSARFLPLSDNGIEGPELGLFTTELRTTFRYNGGEIFNFRGDDDVWVFINNKLALDIGGCHAAESADLNMDARAADLGIVVGQNYDLVLFHAERCFGESNFKATMSLRQDQGICPNQCNAPQERGSCDKSTGQCTCYQGWEGVDCGTPSGSANSDFPEQRLPDCASRAERVFSTYGIAAAAFFAMVIAGIA